MTALLFIIAAYAPTVWYVIVAVRGRTFRRSLGWILLSASATTMFVNPAGPSWLPSDLWEWTVIACALVIVLRRGVVIFSLPVIGILVVGLAYFVSVAWSPWSKAAMGNGVRAIAAAAFMIACIVEVAGRRRTGTKVMYAVAPAIVLTAISVVVFRLSPALKWAYLSDAKNAILLGPDLPLLEAAKIVVNISDPDKSGGLLFLNANAASMTLAVAALCVGGWAVRARSHTLGVVAAVAAIGVVFTGSKTPIILVVVSAVFIAFCVTVVLAHGSRRVRWGAGIGALAAIVVVALVIILQPGLNNAFAKTILPRRVVWAEAIALIASQPILGAGTGGWESWWGVRASHYGLPSDLPPHNLLLYTATQLGVIFALLVVAIEIIAIGQFVVVARRTEDVRRRWLLLLGGTAWLWMVLHGMADNTSLFGNSAALALLGVVYGSLFAPASSAPRMWTLEIRRRATAVAAAGAASSHGIPPEPHG